MGDNKESLNCCAYNPDRHSPAETLEMIVGTCPEMEKLFPFGFMELQNMGCEKRTINDAESALIPTKLISGGGISFISALPKDKFSVYPEPDVLKLSIINT